MAGATLLVNGRVVDGDNTPAWVGDVLLVGDRIAAMGPVGSIDIAAFVAPGAQVVHVDCSGKIVAPGFIDVHTHDDAVVLDMPDMLPKVSQGITTVITGNCGISLVPMVSLEPMAPLSLLGKSQFKFQGIAPYAEALRRDPPAVNVAALVGHTTLRMCHMAGLDRPASQDEITAMGHDLALAMQDGALGLSSGVFYKEAYAADAQELTALACVAARAGGIYATHIRDELAGILPALQEAATTAKQAGLPLVLSHHKCAGPANWGRTRETLPFIEALATQQDLAMDVYPYTAGSTVLREDLVDGVIDILITGSQTHPEMTGRYLAEIAALWGIGQKEACLRLMPGGACYFQMREDDVERVIAHPLSMIGSDGLPHDERPHPRLWGAFPRVLGSYWRDKGILALEQAIHKMSGLSARRFRLGQRGTLKVGHFADVVVFDPLLVRDMATYENPKQISAGIEGVWVNGVLSYSAQTQRTQARAGRFVRRQSSTHA
ncbi:N-acyl-D-amino-acid deacylase family protein [Rhodoferax aquaticus]|uniref:D-aminoacylase n=1 Tax=Rhodoferax aquaticus TaxID=2527691 RepID=A0A515EUA1_9BURK|nr:D-aminoacylase [Rhodoferax aquaticus]QDL56257.1 D-aminoacylase [Rhodoferax aquaticus]